MESIRNLRYFVAVADEQSFTRAAARLGVSQPTLSKQLKELETEFGQPLFDRTTRTVTLTAAGEVLYERARSIVGLYDRARIDLAQSGTIAGDVRLALAETPCMASLVEAVALLRQRAPLVRVAFRAADEEHARHRLQTGLADVAVFAGHADLGGLASMKLAQSSRWGVLTAAGGPLAHLEAVRACDLAGLPVWISEQACRRDEFAAWFGSAAGRITIAGSYDLVFNASLVARAGAAHVLCLEGIVSGLAEVGLRWLPLSPALPADVVAAWDKTRSFTPAVQLLLELWRAIEARHSQPDTL